MHLDVIVSMIVYTLATIAFYLLGAGILNGMGKVPGGKEMISVLANIYTQTLGPWSLWLFYFGAVMILYGTIFAVTAGNSRMLADFSQLLGFYKRDEYRRRTRIRDLYILAITILAVSLYFVFGQAPVTLVVWTGIGQAALLPIVAFGTVFLAVRHLTPELKVPRWMMVLLWLAAIIITGFIVPSLYLEFVKIF
jgi:Mn2+/Fe2+ NRAMP family transporter